MSIKSKIAKVVAHIKSTTLPLNSNRVINEMRTLYPKSYEKYKYKLDVKCLPLDKRDKESLLPFYIERKILIYDKPQCKYCGSKEGKVFDKYRVYSNISVGWPNYCSESCSKINAEAFEKRKQTCLEKYGVDNVSKNSIVSKKIVSSNKKARLADPTIIKRQIETRKLLYGDNEELLLAKRKKTNMKVRGVAFPTQDASVRKKCKKTWLKKLGVDNPSKSHKVQNKIKTSWKRTKDANIAGHVFANLQGYEPLALEYLVYKYKVPASKIKTNFSGIPYTYENKNHIYFPDFKINIDGARFYVEVKSVYTAGLSNTPSNPIADFSILKTKADAVINSGHIYILMILDDKKLLSITSGSPNYKKLRKALGISG